MECRVTWHQDLRAVQLLTTDFSCPNVLVSESTIGSIHGLTITCTTFTFVVEGQSNGRVRIILTTYRGSAILSAKIG